METFDRFAVAERMGIFLEMCRSSWRWISELLESGNALRGRRTNELMSPDNMKTILMIAFHYPPYGGGTGKQRTLKFSRYLPDFGWKPVILTTNPRAYPQLGEDGLDEIPQGVTVHRSFALDTARHLSIHGSYLKWMAMPDRWSSWCLGAVPYGLHLLHKFKPRVIWSTYPIATAHLIGLVLHRLTGIPWIADIRDPMTEDAFPPDPYTRTVYRRIERATVDHCARAVFTSPGTFRMYAKRYDQHPWNRWALIPNGYDEADFTVAEALGRSRGACPQKCTVLLHSGVVYSSERNPNAFFAALAELRRGGKISSDDLKIILRASGNEEGYRKQLEENSIDDIVVLQPVVSHHNALAEMLSVDGLLIFQASNCNNQIPAKIYEYFRARRPIFAMTDPEGDTAGALRAAGIDTIVRLDSKEEIANGFLKFLSQVRDGSAPVARDVSKDGWSRKSLTGELVKLLDSVG